LAPGNGGKKVPDWRSGCSSIELSQFLLISSTFSLDESYLDVCVPLQSK
jgi:hypothetical protein